MKCRLINSNIKSDYTKNLLKEKGVEDFEDFINPSESNLSTPYDLDYIEEGAKKLTAMDIHLRQFYITI